MVYGSLLDQETHGVPALVGTKTAETKAIYETTSVLVIDAVRIITEMPN